MISKTGIKRIKSSLWTERAIVSEGGWIIEMET